MNRPAGIEGLGVEDQVFAVYSKFPNCYARVLETNAAFADLYAAVLADRRNRTRLFEGAPTWAKAANVIRSRLSPESLGRLNEYVRSAVLALLGSDGRRIDYLRRTCRRPVQTLAKYKDLKARVMAATEALGPEYSLTTRCFWVMRGITGFDDRRYRCRGCGKPVLAGWNATSLDSVPYKYCCAKCRANDETYKATLAEAIRRKYGVPNSMQDEGVRQKARRTMAERYGVEYAAQSPEIYRKVQESKIRRYGNPTGSAAKLKRHFTPEIRRKIEATNVRKFGVAHPLQSAAVHEKTVKARPRLQGRPFGATSSGLEQKVFEALSLAFGSGRVLRHYKSEAYPFYCDFYVEPIDTYVEFNGYWMHGGHVFDPGDRGDAERLETWRERARTSGSYAAAVKTWTERDPLKAETARRNGLKYVVLWTINDAYEWIESLNKERRT